MSTLNFTASRVANHSCPPSQSQAFLWDSQVPGLGVRATPGGKKAYIFQAKLAGKTLRLPIGDPKTYTIDEARRQARELRHLIDQGRDPRQVRADQLAAEKAARDAKAAQAQAERIRQLREAVTVGQAWAIYIAERHPFWSDKHLEDHQRMMQRGGLSRKRSAKLTVPGPLAAFSHCRLIDLTTEQIVQWAQAEGQQRPTSARLAWRLLRAFLNWCLEHPDYRGLLDRNPAVSKKTRERLGEPGVRDDVLQREQLAVWFQEVANVGNATISVYLQCLLLTGARRDEMAALRWADIDFDWATIQLREKAKKTQGKKLRTIPLTPYVAALLQRLPRQSEWVFASPLSHSGHLADPSNAHRTLCKRAGLSLTLHGLRRTFATLSEWIEMPAGVTAQLMGHSSNAIAERHYKRRSVDLLRGWHTKFEAWLLREAGLLQELRQVASSLVTT